MKNDPNFVSQSTNMTADSYMDEGQAQINQEINVAASNRTRSWVDPNE